MKLRNHENEEKQHRMQSMQGMKDVFVQGKKVILFQGRLTGCSGMRKEKYRTKTKRILEKWLWIYRTGILCD